MEIDVSIHFKHKGGYSKVELITLTREDIDDLALQKHRDSYDEGTVTLASVCGYEAIRP